MSQQALNRGTLSYVLEVWGLAFMIQRSIVDAIQPKQRLVP
ncbi:MAG: hypothetical protein VX677_14390 [Candidatus Poribacteria bacterium]|nr:hypothetical protein [Candidatus Poribacteria bacterium]